MTSVNVSTTELHEGDTMKVGIEVDGKTLIVEMRVEKILLLQRDVRVSVRYYLAIPQPDEVIELVPAAKGEGA